MHSKAALKDKWKGLPDMVKTLASLCRGGMEGLDLAGAVIISIKYAHGQTQQSIFLLYYGKARDYMASPFPEDL